MPQAFGKRREIAVVVHLHECTLSIDPRPTYLGAQMLPRAIFPQTAWRGLIPAFLGVLGVGGPRLSFKTEVTKVTRATASFLFHDLGLL
jgi:hypothetical protein